LLVYAGDAFTVTPLTDDTETIESQLSALTTDIMPSEAAIQGLYWKKPLNCLNRLAFKKARYCWLPMA